MRIYLLEGNEKIELFSGYSFCSADDELKCAQFFPPLFKNKEVVDWVYLTRFEISGNIFKIYDPKPLNLHMPKKYEVLEVIFIEPKLEPIPRFLNLKTRPNYAIVFNSIDLKYIGTFHGIWNHMKDGLVSLLELKGLPLKNIRVGLLGKDVRAVNLEHIDTFFSKTLRPQNMQLYLQLLVDSDDELSFFLCGQKLTLKGVPSLPKAIATRASAILESNTGSVDELKTWRRLSVAAVNCGVILPLLASVNNGEFDLGNEEMMELDLNLACASSLSTIDVFSREILNLIHFVHINSNEATWCRNFWLPLLNYCFIYNGGPVNFGIDHEVETKFLFYPKTFSKMDCAATIKLGSTDSSATSLPILILEAGKETVESGEEHKDSSKIYGLMSFACYTLAYELKNRGKRPELAVVYGILIGGLKCQFLTAHAKVKELEDGTCEIYTVVSYRDDWEIFLFQELNWDQGAEPMEFNAVDEAFKSILSFIKIVKNRIDLILSDAESNNDDPTRRYASRRDQASFSKSRGSSASKTPKKFQITTTTQSNITMPFSSSPLKSPLTKRQRKHSAFEAQVYRQCAISFKNIFPRIYRLDQVQTPEGPCFDYVFELLTPLVHKEDFISSELFNCEDPYDFIIACLRFHIHCMYGLYLLHDQLKIVHGDLKPSNIMYSNLDQVWKLIDFDHSVPIEESSRTARSGGTRGYWAPECVEGTGLFTPASDIYSFGQIIEDVFFIFLMEIVCTGFTGGEEYKALERGCFAMTKLMRKMKMESPEDRPTALESLQILVDALNEIDPNMEVNDNIIESARILLTLKPITMYETAEIEIPILLYKPSKIAKIESEKDIREVDVPNLVQ